MTALLTLLSPGIAATQAMAPVASRGKTQSAAAVTDDASMCSMVSTGHLWLDWFLVFCVCVPAFSFLDLFVLNSFGRIISVLNVKCKLGMPVLQYRKYLVVQ